MGPYSRQLAQFIYCISMGVSLALVFENVIGDHGDAIRALEIIREDMLNGASERDEGATVLRVKFAH